MMERTRRKVFLTFASVYSAVSNTALKVIVAMTPIEFLVEERRYIEERIDESIEAAKHTLKEYAKAKSIQNETTKTLLKNFSNLYWKNFCTY